MQFLGSLLYRSFRKIHSIVLESYLKYNIKGGVKRFIFMTIQK